MGQFLCNKYVSPVQIVTVSMFPFDLVYLKFCEGHIQKIYVYTINMVTINKFVKWKKFFGLFLSHEVQKRLNWKCWNLI